MFEDAYPELVIRPDGVEEVRWVPADTPDELEDHIRHLTSNFQMRPRIPLRRVSFVRDDTSNGTDQVASAPAHFQPVPIETDHDPNLLIKALTSPLVPLHRLDELADLLDSYTEYLTRQRPSLIKTGWPDADFGRARWLHYHCSPLYPTRLPASAFSRVYESDEDPQAGRWIREALSLWEVWQLADYDALPRAADGNTIYTYTWAQEPHRLPELPEAPLCEYEKAPRIERLSPDLATRLDDLRDCLLGLKVEILQTCIATLRDRRPEDLWPSVVRILKHELSVDALQILLTLDLLYEDEGTIYHWARLCGWEPLHFSNSGVVDLLRIVGHCEKEIRFQHMDRLCLQLELLRSLNEHPDPAGLTNLQRDFNRWRVAEAHFWHSFTERLNRDLGDNFTKVDVTVTRTLASMHAEQYRLLLGSFADFQIHHLQLFGKPLPLTINTSGPQIPASASMPPDFLFRKQGAVWVIRFNGQETHCSHKLGFSYIAVLLENPGKEFLATDLRRIVDPSEPSVEFATATGASDYVVNFITEAEVRRRERREARDDRHNYNAAIMSLEQQYRDLLKTGQSQKAAETKDRLDKLKRLLNARFSRKGHPRPTDDSERARKSVSNNIDRALKALRERNPPAYLHLENSITKGQFIRYLPENPITWLVERK